MKNQFRKPLYRQGPWEKEGSLDDLFIGVTRPDGSWAHIAHVHTEGHNPPRYEEAEANAAIIVKAPELYETVKKLTFILGRSNLSTHPDHQKAIELLTGINKELLQICQAKQT